MHLFYPLPILPSSILPLPTTAANLPTKVSGGRRGGGANISSRILPYLFFNISRCTSRVPPGLTLSPPLSFFLEDRKESPSSFCFRLPLLCPLLYRGPQRLRITPHIRPTLASLNGRQIIAFLFRTVCRQALNLIGGRGGSRRRVRHFWRRRVSVIQRPCVTSTHLYV